MASLVGKLFPWLTSSRSHRPQCPASLSSGHAPDRACNSLVAETISIRPLCRPGRPKTCEDAWLDCLIAALEKARVLEPKKAGVYFDQWIGLRDRTESSMRVERKHGFEMPWRSSEGDHASLRQYSGEYQRYVDSGSAAKWKAYRGIVPAWFFFFFLPPPVIRVASLLWLQSPEGPGFPGVTTGGVESEFDTHRPLPEWYQPPP